MAKLKTVNRIMAVWRKHGGEEGVDDFLAGRTKLLSVEPFALDETQTHDVGGILLSEKAYLLLSKVVALNMSAETENVESSERYELADIHNNKININPADEITDVVKTIVDGVERKMRSRGGFGNRFDRDVSFNYAVHYVSFGPDLYHIFVFRFSYGFHIFADKTINEK